LKKPIAGGAGGAAGLEVALPHPGTSQPAPLTRFLENERLLAGLLALAGAVLAGVDAEQRAQRQDRRLRRVPRAVRVLAGDEVVQHLVEKDQVVRSDVS